MKITHQQSVSYLEVDPNFSLTMENLAKYLQEAAIRHSESIDDGSKNIIKSQQAWVLNKILGSIKHLG